ncbi:Flagellar hook-associated protein FlgK [hydrothermal vent metagenome]|uniref:Flagellar hook-associated protein FlgK n=1 Tax=hydrothermal vent metagenome TaxID=652676 RepID=A0A3B1DI52_9ZZZZ
MGLNATLQLSGRSLEVFSTGIQVAGQNISNANTPGYIREDLLLTTSLPYKQGQQVLGTGVQVGGIKQQLNLFLENRIHAANSEAETINARLEIYQQLETEIGELSDTDLSSSLNGFLASVNDVVNQPEEIGLREIAIQQGSKLANDVSTLRLRIDDLRKLQTVRVNELINEANTLIDQISELNPKITKIESSGLLQSDAGALRTQRYNALTRLSKIVPINFRETSDGGVDVRTGSDFLVLGTIKQKLESVVAIDRGVGVVDVQLTKTKNVISVTGGELRGVIEGRDSILGGFVDDLDKYTATLITQFNTIYTSGEGLSGYDSITGETNVFDTSVALNDAAALLPSKPENGSFQIKITNKLTGVQEITNVNIDLDGIGGNDTTLASLQATLNGIGNLSASITTQGELKLDAGTGYDIRFGNDTSGTLAALGINTFFTGSNSSNIGVNDLVKQNQEFFATGEGGGPSDGRNIAKLAQFIDKPIAALGGVSLDESYNSIQSKIAQSASTEKTVAAGAQGLVDSLLSQREQYSGVSLDEETIKIMEFQQGFQAAARLISTIDELFTILLTM